MWNSFGSLRERVREHAKSAAQVAQGVLKAAAAEDDYPDQPNEPAQDDSWGSWQPDHPDQTAPNASVTQQHQPPPADPARPPPDDAPPPPPPEDAFVSAKPPVFNPAPRAKRTSRYVVTGVATSQAEPAAPAMPTPSFFTPRPPVIGGQSQEDVAEGGGEEMPASSEHVAEEPAGVAAPDAHVRTSEMPPAPPEDLGTFAPQTMHEQPPAEGGLPTDDNWTPPPPAGDVFADWGFPAEQQTSQGETAPADDSFAGWGIDVPTAERAHKQPEIIAEPQVESASASSDVAETTLETEQPHKTKMPPAEDSFTGWDVREPPVESIPQNDKSAPVDSSDDTFADSGVPEEQTEEQFSEELAQNTTNEASPGMQPKQSESTAAEAPAEESFVDWAVPETTPAEPSAAPTVSQTEIQPPEDPFADWGVSGDTSNGQAHSTEAPPPSDMFAGWNIPEAVDEKNSDQDAAVPADTDSFAGSNVQGNIAKDREEQDTTFVANSTTEAPAENDTFADWNVVTPETEPKKVSDTPIPATDDTFAGWDVPDVTAALHGDQSEGNMSTSKVNLHVSANSTTEALTGNDTFADWNAVTPKTEPKKVSETSVPATDDAFADWDVPDTTAVQQGDQSGETMSTSQAQSNGDKNTQDPRNEDAFADWGESDGGWSIGEEASGTQGVDDGADWFTNGIASGDANIASDATADENVTSSKQTAKFEQDHQQKESEKELSSVPAPRRSATTAVETKDLTTESTSQPEHSPAVDIDDVFVQKENDDDEKSELETSTQVPDVAPQKGSNVWSFFESLSGPQNGVHITSSSAADTQWNERVPRPEDPSQLSPVQDRIETSDPAPPAGSWFSDFGTADIQPRRPGENASRAEALTEQDMYVAEAVSGREQERFAAQQSDMTRQIEELQEQMRSLMLERDSAVTARISAERERDDLQNSNTAITADLLQSREQSEYLSTQRDALQKERDAALEQRIDVERERDEAIQRGGEGLREARGVIEAMRNNQDYSEKREAAITEQIRSLRADLDRISQERNSLIGESEDLRVALRDVESRSQQREDELRQRLQISEHKSEIARLEREKALETNTLHVDEKQRLVEAERDRAAALAQSEGRVLELENYIATMQTDRDDENLRIDLFSKQIEEMKDRTQDVIDERNVLHDEKRNLEEEIEEYKRLEETHERDLYEARREAASLASERDEARQRFMSLKEQQKELAKRVDSLTGERDQLVKARTAAIASSSSVSENEKNLVLECEQKTRAVAMLQKKLTSAVAKIEKVTSQRSTFQRQRDEAGARLRAAGVEFGALNAKLEELTVAKNSLQNQIVQIRDERDIALSKVEDMITLESQVKITQEGLDSKTKEIEDLQMKLRDSMQEVVNVQDSSASAQQKVGTLTSEVSELRGKLEVLSRERDLIQKQTNDLEQEKVTLQQALSGRDQEAKQLSKQLRSLEAEFTTYQEKSTVELGIAKAELTSEQTLHQEVQTKLAELQGEVSTNSSAVDQVRSMLLSALRRTCSDALRGTQALSPKHWQSVDNLLASDENATAVTLTDLMSTYNDVSAQLTRNCLRATEENIALQDKCDESAKRVSVLELEKAQLLANTSEVESLRTRLTDVNNKRDAMQAEKLDMEAIIVCLREQAENATHRTAEVEAQLEAMTREMRAELDGRLRASTEEQDRLIQETEKVKGNLNSIWNMLQRSLGQEQLELLHQELGQHNESGENVGVLALRATASIVAEMSRTRSSIEDTQSNLMSAEAEVARLTDRAEIAERERDSAKGTNERLERKLMNSLAEGREEAQSHYEGVVAQLEDELEDAKQELSRVSDKANRSEKETGELRALCSKLTSQFNGRTNELDEAEEKIVYLQDQVTTLEEDLEEAHTRLKVLEEESTEARNSDVNRLTTQLEETISQLEDIEKECTRLREAHDEAENSAKESRLLASTHKQAEENLQIAIEQLEAAQESAVEQRTIELQKRLEDSEEKCKTAMEREAAATVTQKQLNVRDEEIKELRGALGRLADERVELKLELEKSLSRLNHPDAGGQLVDRRVVRQLLVSYFRVGSVRRRDVLELMSRMLAFTDSDNIAVGLKRRALMDRLGSLVQPPELDDATLPPLGTVSDKWIEFLMKETEEGEDQGKGW